MGRYDSWAGDIYKYSSHFIMGEKHGYDGNVPSGKLT